MIFSSALIGVFIISVAVSLLISLLYKVLIDEEKASRVKGRMNDLKEKAEEAREEGDQEKAKKHMNKMMKHSSKQMKMQMKPMAVTFILIIPLFWFVFPNLYNPAIVNINQTNTLQYKDVETSISLENVDPLKVSVNGETYIKGETLKLDSYLMEVSNYDADKNELKLSRISAKLPFTLPFIGDTLGWIGWYILVAIGFGQIFRKLLGVMQ